MAQPDRPDGLPTEATWNAKENEWELGEKNADGKEVGPWIWWYPDGVVVCRCGYDDQGRTHGLLQRFHQNGELAQQATWFHGKTHGVQMWTRASEGPSDKPLPPNIPPEAIRMDVPYFHGNAQPHHFALFRESGRDLELPVDDDGRIEDLASYLEHVVPETTLQLLEPAKALNGVELVNADYRRWIYEGPSGEHWRVRQFDDGATSVDTWIVDTETFNRCFTLSTYGFLRHIEGRRPAGVPEDATYDRLAKRWWHGPSDGAERVGQWSCWDDEGRLRGYQTYGDPGVLHGPAVELYPDGSPQAEGQHWRGNKRGLWTYHRHASSPYQMFPSTDDSVWRAEIEFDALGKNLFQRYFLSDGAACARNGHPLEVAYADELFDTNISGWFQAHLCEQVPPRDVQDPGASSRRHWAELTGRPPHVDHDLVASFVDARGDESIYGWQWSLSIDGSRGYMRRNVFENFLSELRYGNTALFEFFCGVSKIGRCGGDRLLLDFIQCDLGVLERPSVTMKLLGDEGLEPFATDIDHFAYLTSAGEAFCKQKLSPEGFGDVWRKLSGHVRPDGVWTTFHDRYAPSEFDPCSHGGLPVALERRSRWLLALLQGELDDITEKFERDDTNLDDPLYSIESAATHVPIGLYLMWRRFFFEEEDELRELLVAAKASASRLLRDTAKIVEEVMYGREAIGPVEDIHDVRDEFLDRYSPN